MSKKSVNVQRRDLAREAAKHLPLNIEQCLTVVDTIFCEIANAIMDGKDVEVYGFGTFVQEIVPEHAAVNPQDRSPITVPTYRKFKYIPHPALKLRVKNSVKTQEETQK